MLLASSVPAEDWKARSASRHAPPFSHAWNIGWDSVCWGTRRKIMGQSQNDWSCDWPWWLWFMTVVIWFVLVVFYFFAQLSMLACGCFREDLPPQEMQDGRIEKLYIVQQFQQCYSHHFTSIYHPCGYHLPVVRWNKAVYTCLSKNIQSHQHLTPLGVQ